MKANKAKTSGKVVKKQAKRVVKKELEASISDKFFDALKSLGHDAGKFSKEIKKTSKALAKKLAGKYKEVKSAVEDKLESKVKSIKPKSIIKPQNSGGKSVVSAVKKAEKVVARVSKTAVKAKTPRPVTVGVRTSKAAAGGSAEKKVTPASAPKATGTKVVAKKPSAISKAASDKPKTTVSRTRKASLKTASAPAVPAKTVEPATVPSTDKI